MATSPDVIVVGGGAVGAASARELARAGRAVLVLDRGPTGDGAAWRAAAGMLAPQIEARPEDPLYELALAGRERYEPLAAALREATGIDIGLWQEGIARVATSEAEALEVRARVAWQRQQGHLCDWLDADEVRSRFPWLGPTLGALWAPREGALDPTRLVEALLADARAHGARLVRDEALGLEREGRRATAVLGAAGRYPAGEIVIAAGAWSGRLQGLPRPLTVEPVRGQMAALPWPAGIPRAVVFNRDCYLVARGTEAIAGSTMENVGYAPVVTEEGIDRILASATLLCPPLAQAPVLRTWAGLRPMTPDGLPVVGRAPVIENLWYAAGHGRNGILLAALTGEIVRQLLDREPTVEEIDTLDPQRFWRW